ncbi:MAG: hypothetical protein KGS61_03920 [Verrucomicrobia bacterium]|nr:hypothetical protein [Verrucomicrobiota bacterium]
MKNRFVDDQATFLQGTALSGPRVGQALDGAVEIGGGNDDLNPFDRKQFQTAASSGLWQSIKRRFGNNPHVADPSAHPAYKFQVLVVGDHDKSHLLSRVVVLAQAREGKYRLRPATAAQWGLKPHTDLTRSSVRSVDPQAVARVFRMLEAFP